MTEQPEWMPSDDAIRVCSAVDHVENANTKLFVVTAIRELIRKTGLRAQIFALNELEESCAIYEELQTLEISAGEFYERLHDIELELEK